MAIVTRGRVLTNVEDASALPFSATAPSSQPIARRIPREVVDAHAEARAIVSRAEDTAKTLLAEARKASSNVAALAAGEARDLEVAKLASAFLLLRSREEARAEGDIARAIALAVMLAERLVGAELEVHPQRIAQMARRALEEARGARKVTIAAHPLDVDALRSKVDELNVLTGALEIAADPTLSRGSLSLHTDLGSLDARLNPQLDRLAAALRDAFRAP
jgi:type III secretion protein L